MRKPGEKTAAEIRAALSGIRCFLLDMDGTFYLGDRIIEGSMEFLQKVEQTGRSYLFLTNNSSRSVQHYVEKLGRLGLHVGEDKILTSGQAAAQYLKREYPGKRVFLLGNPSLREEMEKHGIALEDEHPDLVLVGFDTTLDYAKMTRVCDSSAAARSISPRIRISTAPPKAALFPTSARSWPLSRPRPGGRRT